jgi:hypothetical protein
LEITVYWHDTILGIDHFRRDEKRVTIGTDRGVSYVVPSQEIGSRFDFVRVKGPTAELSIHPSMKGSARLSGKMETLEDLRAKGRSTITLSGQDIAKVQVGTVNFFFMFVPEPPAVPKGEILDQGPLFWRLQAGIVALAALIFGFLVAFKPPVIGIVEEFPEKYRKIIVQEYKKKEERKKEASEVKVIGDKASEGQKVEGALKQEKVAKQGSNEGEGMREKGPEGKRGKPNAANETGIQNRPKTSASRKVVDAPVRAKNEGILDALKGTGLGTRLAKVSGVAGGATGNDPLDKALSGTGGGGIQDGRGAGGSGLVGTGKGGGGTAEGVGGLGSKGFGGGAKGTGVGSIPGKGEFAVGTEGVGVSVVGGLTREEIERVINAHRSEVGFCYQKELQKDPGLFGKIKLRWTIVAGGSVSSVSTAENQTGSVSLENCIRDRLKTWTFPSPAGGAQAVVDWPWIFKPSQG